VSSGHQFVRDCKNELGQTKNATKLFWAARNRKLSDQEKTEIADQSQDLLRVMFLGTLFIIPGSGFLIILLVKGGDKLGVRFLPSSFVKEKHDIQKIEK
jgi:hypothetical protein